jgi:hypothetical protein
VLEGSGKDSLAWADAHRSGRAAQPQMPQLRRTRAALLRLPAVIFPAQPLSLKRVSAMGTPFGVCDALLAHAKSVDGGGIASFGPASRVGVLLNVVSDSVTPHAATRAGDLPIGTDASGNAVVHAVGGARVRLLRCFLEGEEQVCEVEPLDDEVLSPSRRERLEDEARMAHALLARVVASEGVHIESSVLDEELGGREVCEPSCHPLWLSDEEPPEEPPLLSFWLASRLPLTTVLRAQLLSIACPLRRMMEITDILRLLDDPQRARGEGYRFKLLVNHAASDHYCSTGLNASMAPRMVVSPAPPPFSGWTSHNSFPHG